MRRSTIRDRARRLAVLCAGLTLLFGGRSADAACTVPFLPDTENPGAFRGCCDGTNMLATNAACIDEANPCRVGTCNASGQCVDSGNRASSADCRSPVNPCRMGDCGNGNCTGPFDLTDECKPADGNVCTDDCLPNDATTGDSFDVLCGPFNITPRTCSIVNGTASCKLGDCDASGGCVERAGEPPAQCEGNLTECQKFICTDIVNGDPVCEKVAHDVGMNCEAAPKVDDPALCDPNDAGYNPVNNAFCLSDCREKTCKDNGNCTWNDDEFQGWICEDDGQQCTKGACNSNGNCTNVQNLPNTNRPCNSDGNVCTLDECRDGACNHANDDPNVPDGTACTSSNSCSEGAQCSGATCAITDCHENDRFCMGCIGSPCNGGAPSTGCGCP